ncbi:thioredoxin family protein [Flavobacterium kingsejongi]|uniref:Thioredoxin family protein n=1 Tax=Flavobacterium kingsejongi TaxID=1678728 RepID=A0A2S1LLQ7_9FLAO|nr:thioredoxin family protein [Flavobacterium kingsejongi]AWG24649.1 thioredoxin family protein [Flavobacterium kingsejongi]
MKLKTIVLCLFLIGSFSQLKAQEHASVILEKAVHQAKKEHKKVFVLFHASWCSWCKKMESNMYSAANKTFFEKNYVITHLVVQESKQNKKLENPGAETILKEFKAENVGIPFWIIYDENGKPLENAFNSKGENLGCPATPEEVAEFIGKLKRTATVSEKQSKAIEAAFILKKK